MRVDRTEGSIGISKLYNVGREGNGFSGKFLVTKLLLVVSH